VFTNIHANPQPLANQTIYHSTMQISVQSNIMQVMPKLEKFTSRQAPFTIAKALTETAKHVRKALGDATNTVFDRPTAFTRNAFAFLPARKDKLQAIVFAKDKQAKYLKFQVQGGGRRVKGFEKRFGAEGQADEQSGMQHLVPTKRIKLNASGGVSLATIKAISTNLNSSGKAARYFIGKPNGSGQNAGRGYGIYARVNNNKRLEALMVFANRPQYRKRFDMTAIGGRVVNAHFDAELRKAWAIALRTAR
jgi:hypothetical protein